MSLWLTSLMLMACSPDESNAMQLAEESLPRVRSVLVEETTFTTQLKLSASLQGIQTAVLLPKSAGRVAKVHVRIGDKVKSGQLLLQIEDADYQQGLLEARAAYRLAKAQAKQAKANLQRFRRLHKQGVATQLKLEEVQLASELTTQQAHRAHAAEKIARARVADTRLIAPFAGVVIARNVERGELLGAAITRPPLQIADLSKIRAIGSIGEANLSVIKEGDTIEVFVPALGQQLFATIDRINAAVDPVLRTVQIEATIDNSTGVLKHGMSAQLKIQSHRQQILAIPRSALLDRKAGGARVMVLDGDTVKSVAIRYDRSPSDLVPILEGLSLGDKVISAGHSRLKNGDRVVELTE